MSEYRVKQESQFLKGGGVFLLHCWHISPALLVFGLCFGLFLFVPSGVAIESSDEANLDVVHAEPSSKLNQIKINSASLNQLVMLKGVGEKKALAILHWRELHGDFKSVEDLQNVKGIGRKIIQDNKALLAL